MSQRHRRYSNRRFSIIIGEDGKVWAPDRRTSSSSTGNIPSSSGQASNIETGIENHGFDPDLPMQEVHLGYSDQIRRASYSYLRKEVEFDYHEIELEDLFMRFSTHPTKGLRLNKVPEHLVKYGRNELTPPPKESLLVTFLKTLVGGFQLLLWAGAILCFMAYGTQCLYMDSPPMDNLCLGIVLAVLVLVLGLFTFYQEFSSNKIMESFSKMVPNYASVTRDGRTMEINATELVVGDLVDVKGGDRIPADLRLIECFGFKVDNSSLTGESDPQSRSVKTTHDDPLESKNLAFFSTNAIEGTAKGIVVAVGDSTFIGKIACLTSRLDSSDTPMAREVSHFVKLISAIAVFFGVVFFIISMSMGYEWIDSALFLIGVIVANVPEGLLVTFTVILALTAKRMANKNCLVRQLHAVETLGSTTVICSDKTGTLTQNKMTVSHMWYNGRTVSTLIHDIDTALVNADKGFGKLSTVACLCSRARFLPDQQNVNIQQRKINGDASESAILRCMESIKGNVQKFQMSRKKLFEIPFNSSNKWQLSIHDMNDPKDPRYLLVMKGAPEKVLEYCTKIIIGESLHLLDSAWKSSVNQTCEELGSMGERVLGFCELYLPNDKYPRGYKFDADNLDFLQLGLHFTGLMSMVDPPRPGVHESVRTCRSAGIKVVMVTGDHPVTAKAIAKSVGIISYGDDEDELEEYQKVALVSGSELLEMSTEQLDSLIRCREEIVFARVSPQQKLIIVEAFQRAGHVVAVTGDGVNDSPALKKADIGIAMGIAGSDVSKQAADMILLDDNFNSIVTGVEEGRLIFDNLKKCICYLLTANMPELVPFMAYVVLKIPLPLGTIPMLLICLGTDILPTISLSYETAEEDIMMRPPRDPKVEKLVTDKLISYSYGNLGIIESFAGFTAYFVIMGQNGFWGDRLLGISGQWDSSAVNDLTDSYGQEWTYKSRKELERTCWTGYFVAIVVCQWGNVLISKMRRTSLYTKLFDNWVVFLAIAAETGLAALFTYTPGLNVAITYMPIKVWWWLPALPWCVYLILHDEMRRFVLRKCPKWKWYQTEMYY